MLCAVCTVVYYIHSGSAKCAVKSAHRCLQQYSAGCRVLYKVESVHCASGREAIAARGNYHQAADRAPHQSSGDHHDDFDQHRTML